MKLSQILLYAAIIATAGRVNAGDNEATSQVCLQALKEAVRNFSHIDNKVTWERDYAKDFCDKLKTSARASSDTKADIAIDAIGLGAEHKQDSASALDKEFCQNEKDNQKFSQSVRGWMYVAHPEALKDFNRCIATDRGTLGVRWEVREVDACNVDILAVYNKTAKPNPDLAKVTSHSEINLSCRKLPKSLSATQQSISCRRQGWGGGRLIVDTSQGPVFADIDPVKDLPKKPLQRTLAKTDKKMLEQELGWPNGTRSQGVSCDANRVCTGSFELPENAVFEKIERKCNSHEINENGHPSCAWSMYASGDPNPAANFRLVGKKVTWSRYMDAWSRWTEIYTVTFDVPHVATSDEKALLKKDEEAHKEYEKVMAAGPCFSKSERKMK